MSYTWTTGEVITADKLNNTGGGTNYDLVLTETFAENQDPTMTGTGLSFEELMEKIDNGDDVSVKYIRHTDYGQHDSANSIYCGHNRTGSVDNFSVYGARFSGTQLTQIIDYNHGSEGVNLVIMGYTLYNFTYNTSTKTYTFTFVGYTD